MNSLLAQKLIAVIRENKSDPMARKTAIIFQTNVVPLISTDKMKDGQDIIALIKEIDALGSPMSETQAPPNTGRQYRVVEFSDDAFSPKKIPPPVPPADSEIKQVEAKVKIPFEKEVFDIFENGMQNAEEQYKTVKAFAKRCSELNIKLNKPKDFADAWTQFYDIARKVLGI